MSLALELLTKLYPEKLIPSSADILVPPGIEERFSYTFFDFGIRWCLAIPKPLVNVTDIMFIHSFWKDQGQVVVIDLSLPTKVKDHQFIMLKMAEINFVRSEKLLNVPGLLGIKSTFGACSLQSMASTGHTSPAVTMVNTRLKSIEKKQGKKTKKSKPIAPPSGEASMKPKASMPAGPSTEGRIAPTLSSDCPF